MKDKNQEIGKLILLFKSKKVKTTDHNFMIQGKKIPLYQFQGRHPWSVRGFSDVIPEINEYMHGLSPQEAEEVFRKAVGLYSQQAIAEKTKTVMPLNAKPKLSTIQKELLETHQLYINIQTGEKFAWDRNLATVSEWASDTIKEILPKNVIKAYSSDPTTYHIKPSKLLFDPYKGTKKQWEKSVNNITIDHLNTYRPPVWQTEDYTTEQLETMQEEYPEWFTHLLQKLFPVESHREIVLDWVSLAIFSRPQSYLSLRGIRGCGKSIFKYLLFHLVGHSYDVSDKILTDYNADFRHKRIVGLDDNTQVGTKAGNALRKAILAPTASLNEKHIQTKESETQFFSMVIASNTSNPFYVEYDERRIVSPQMGTQKMESWNNDFRFYRALEKKKLKQWCVDAIKPVGISLLVRYAKKKPNIALQLRSGNFWNDVFQSLPSFKRFVLASILYFEKPSLDTIFYFDELKDEFRMSEGVRGSVPHWGNFSNWLVGDFRYLDQPVIDPERKIGSCNYNDRSFTVNPHLLGLFIKNKRKTINELPVS